MGIEFALEVLMLLSVHVPHFGRTDVGDTVAQLHEVRVPGGANAFVVFFVRPLRTIATLLIADRVDDLRDDRTELLDHIVVGRAMVVFEHIVERTGCDHNVVLVLGKKVFELFSNGDHLQDVSIEVRLTIVLLIDVLVSLLGILESAVDDRAAHVVFNVW